MPNAYVLVESQFGSKQIGVGTSKSYCTRSHVKEGERGLEVDMRVMTGNRYDHHNGEPVNERELRSARGQIVAVHEHESR